MKMEDRFIRSELNSNIGTLFQFGSGFSLFPAASLDNSIAA
jgi:hypothetical protein